MFGGKKKYVRISFYLMAYIKGGKKNMVKKLYSVFMIYVAMVMIIFSSLITQANPTFLQSNLLSKRLFAYNLLNNCWCITNFNGLSDKRKYKIYKEVYIYLYSKLIDIYRTIFVD